MSVQETKSNNFLFILHESYCFNFCYLTYWHGWNTMELLSSWFNVWDWFMRICIHTTIGWLFWILFHVTHTCTPIWKQMWPARALFAAGRGCSAEHITLLLNETSLQFPCALSEAFHLSLENAHLLCCLWCHTLSFGKLSSTFTHDYKVSGKTLWSCLNAGYPSASIFFLPLEKTHEKRCLRLDVELG